MNASESIKALNAVSGWRLLLYTFLGTWAVGKAGSAIAEIIHGAPDYSAVLKSIADAPAAVVAPTAPKPAPKVGDVSGVRPAPTRSPRRISPVPADEIDALARVLAEKFGPLPAELTPREIDVSGESKALPWVAGLLVAAVAAGWLVSRSSKGSVSPFEVKVAPTEPVKVAPVDVNVVPKVPALGDVLKQVLPGSAPKGQGAAPQAPVDVNNVINLAQNVLQQAQGATKGS